ncbi:tRNA pseudouridine(13) synthase TruD, partial [archaeon]
MANAEVGITEFMDSSAPRIHGIIKERFSDFVVREIDMEGRVCYLQSIDDGGLEASIFGESLPAAAESAEPGLSRHQAFVNTLKESAFAAYEATPSELLAELEIFVDLCIKKDRSCPVEWIGLPCNDKTMRSVIHQAVKQVLGGFIDSDTATKEGMTYIRLQPKHLLKNTQDNKRRRFEGWPKSCPDFLSFTLLKENVDTLHAISILAKHLRISNNSITFNGTKDKRGITAQKLTVYRKKPSDFKKINTYPHNPIMRVGDFAYTPYCARLGRLTGNQFELVLRGVDTSDEDIERACSSLKNRGFVNYFGLQRFGKGGGGTHSMGVYIYHAMWRECVDMLFVPKAGDREGIKQGKLLYKAGKYREASEVLPEAMQAEKGVLR